MTVAEMLSRISSRELTEWHVYEQLYGPLGGERDDRLAALIAHTVANANRHRRAPYPYDDFLLTWGAGRQRREQSTEEMLAIVVGLNKAMGGTDLRPAAAEQG
ncbi:phage tail assembly protein T [Verrucosispora sp. TAA-831]|uniref:phage tail assembly protein T n=1 Tax=Verrucosispora sp. TAA-831 TaxID=3422227 RepID=UPI003D7014CF